MAIKVVEAIDESNDAYQESVLSASIAHPNVVCTVCTRPD